MDLNPTTFLLEIINFFVLVWLLKRFFYKPVLNAIESRRQKIETQLSDAQAQQDKAEQLVTEYHARMADLEQQQSAAKQKLKKEIDAEREKQLQQLQADMDAEETRLRALQEHGFAEHRRQIEQQGLVIGSKFASQLLSRFASPELERLIVLQTLDDLAHRSEADKKRLNHSLNEPGRVVTLTSAFPMPDELKERIAGCLDRLAGKTVSINYCLDPELKAGVHIAVDSMLIEANIQQELTYFWAGHHDS